MATEVQDPALHARGRLGVGDQVGQFKITETLGEGGMAQVFRAVHTVLDRTVAIKVLSREMAETEAAFQRFVAEAKAASRVDHDGIVKVEDIAVHEPSGLPYI